MIKSCCDCAIIVATRLERTSFQLVVLAAEAAVIFLGSCRRLCPSCLPYGAWCLGGRRRKKKRSLLLIKAKKKRGLLLPTTSPQCDFAPTVFLAVSLPPSLSIYFLCMYVYTSVVTAPRGIEYKFPASYTWRKEENRKRLTAAVINMGNVYGKCFYALLVSLCDPATSGESVYCVSGGEGE